MVKTAIVYFGEWRLIIERVLLGENVTITNLLDDFLDNLNEHDKRLVHFSFLLN